MTSQGRHTRILRDQFEGDHVGDSASVFTGTVTEAVIVKERSAKEAAGSPVAMAGTVLLFPPSVCECVRVHVCVSVSVYV